MASFDDYAMDRFKQSKGDGDAPASLKEPEAGEGPLDDLKAVTDELESAAGGGDETAVPSEADGAGGDVKMLAAELGVDEPHAQRLLDAAKGIPNLQDLDGPGLVEAISSNYRLRLQLERSAAGSRVPEEEPPPVEEMPPEGPPALPGEEAAMAGAGPGAGAASPF